MQTRKYKRINTRKTAFQLCQAMHDSQHERRVKMNYIVR